MEKNRLEKARIQWISFRSLVWSCKPPRQLQPEHRQYSRADPFLLTCKTSKRRNMKKPIIGLRLEFYTFTIFYIFMASIPCHRSHGILRWPAQEADGSPGTSMSVLTAGVSIPRSFFIFFSPLPGVFKYAGDGAIVKKALAESTETWSSGWILDHPTRHE